MRIGLLNNLLGISAEDILKESIGDDNILTAGIMAEQFVAQNLKFFNQKSASETLYYWLKDLKKEGAEIDFLIQRSSDILPIEVKSGKSGTLKSLLVFMHLKKLKTAIRFDLKHRDPKKTEEIIATTIFDGHQLQKVSFKLKNYPLFLINFINFE